MINQRCRGKHSIRLAQKGDEGTGMEREIGAVSCIPASYVLLCNGRQVGATDGPVNKLIMMRIIDEFQGVKHSEIFLELLEIQAKQQGFTEFIVASITNERMMKTALKRGFIKRNDEYSKQI